MPTKDERAKAAIGLVAGWTKAADPRDIKDAWQSLVDSGLVWQLDPWFGEMAAAMIADGELRSAGRTG